jgi:hypothetical protein
MAVMRRIRDDRGAAAVEFAMVMPLLVMLVFGIFEFGLAWHTYQVITDAAREGARQAVVANASNQQAVFETVEMAIRRTRPGEVTVRNASYCAPDLPTGALGKNRVEIYGCDWNGGSGSPARVAVRYGFEFTVLGSLLNWGTGQRSIALRTDFWMRNE